MKNIKNEYKSFLDDIEKNIKNKEDLEYVKKRFTAFLDPVLDEINSIIEYKKEEVEDLAVGDKITFHEEGTAWNQYVTAEVSSVEKNDQYDIVTINGGAEQGGVDLLLDGDTYRTMTFDDYPVYYEMGEKTLPLAENVVLKDSSADPQAEAVETTGADAVAAAINADPDHWTVYNTTLVVQGGRILEVRRIWVP